MMDDCSEIRLSVLPSGALGLITLNRPKALNALTHAMIRGINRALDEWESDPDIRAVAFIGEGERAFCAGGDVKAAWSMGMQLKKGVAGAEDPVEFFGDEYRLNRRLHHFTKPLIALMNGITMGGGFGIAGQCPYRIACEKTVFAMPETAIGFFPDVGSAWHLSRLPGKAGFYLGVTGATIGPGDMLLTGLATGFCDHGQMSELPERLDHALVNKNAEAVFRDIVNNQPQPAVFSTHAALIKEAFSVREIEDVIRILKSSDQTFGQESAALMEKRSPTSLRVSLRHLQDASRQDFDIVIERDFRLAQNFMRGTEFYEGVRAVLIDRDGRPRWRPATLREVGPQEMRALFDAAGQALDD